jgi:cytosine/adenosine deaminase-related metal-dependent hydrolase
LRPALAPTIPMHCSEELISGCREIARGNGIGLHMHIAEARFQAVAAQEHYGRTMVRFLDDLGVVGETFTAAHGVWLDDEDFRILAARGANLVHMPLSNLRLGVGLARVKRAREAGVNMGLATDGANSADALDMFEVIKLATLVSRAFADSPAAWVSARDALAMATLGSARCLGFGDRLGAIRAGARADLACLDLTGLNWEPRNCLPVQLVNGAAQGAVTDVLVDGAFIVRDRRFVRIDVDRVAAEAQHAAERVFASTAALRAQAERLMPAVLSHVAEVGSRYRGPVRLLG